MKTHEKLVAILMLAIALYVPCVGCSFGSASISPSSHFAFPNSNVIPIGSASGSKTRLCGILFVQWGSPDGDDQEAATQEEFADIPLFWFNNEVFANPKVVGSWTYPGIAAGRSTHFELIKPAE